MQQPHRVAEAELPDDHEVHVASCALAPVERLLRMQQQQPEHAAPVAREQEGGKRLLHNWQQLSPFLQQRATAAEYRWGNIDGGQAPNFASSWLVPDPELFDLAFSL